MPHRDDNHNDDNTGNFYSAEIPGSPGSKAHETRVKTIIEKREPARASIESRTAKELGSKSNFEKLYLEIFRRVNIDFWMVLMWLGVQSKCLVRQQRTHNYYLLRYVT